MKINAISTIVGVIIGILVSINYRPTPFIQSISGTTPVYEDKDRQEFVARVIDTFEAGNPYSELYQAENFGIEEKEGGTVKVLKLHYAKFENMSKKISPASCPTQRITVASNNQNSDYAKPRYFEVFDTNNCKPSN